MLQSVITYCIVFAAFFIVSYKIYKTLTHKSDSNSPCGGCTGCDLKSEILKNKKAINDKCNDNKEK